MFIYAKTDKKEFVDEITRMVDEGGRYLRVKKELKFLVCVDGESREVIIPVGSYIYVRSFKYNQTTGESKFALSLVDGDGDLTQFTLTETALPYNTLIESLETTDKTKETSTAYSEEATRIKDKASKCDDSLMIQHIIECVMAAILSFCIYSSAGSVVGTLIAFINFWGVFTGIVICKVIGCSRNISNLTAENANVFQWGNAYQDVHIQTRFRNQFMTKCLQKLEAEEKVA